MMFFITPLHNGIPFSYFVQSHHLWPSHTRLRLPLFRADVNSVDPVSEAFKLPSVFMFRSAYHAQQSDRQERVLQVRAHQQ